MKRSGFVGINSVVSAATAVLCCAVLCCAVLHAAVIHFGPLWSVSVTISGTILGYKNFLQACCCQAMLWTTSMQTSKSQGTSLGWLVIGVVLQETGEQLDIDEYDHVVFRVQGDGRKYIANLRTENWLVGGRSHDVWQAFLFARWAMLHLMSTEIHASRCSQALSISCHTVWQTIMYRAQQHGLGKMLQCQAMHDMHVLANTVTSA